MEADHLDFFHDLEDVKRSFRAFADLVPENGTVLANGEDKNTMDALAGKPGVVTFGLDAGDYHADNLSLENGYPAFDLVHDGETVCHIALRVPGLHNVKNAIAAAAASCILGIPGEAIARGLSDFHGAGRRFEFKGRINGADIYDDYAHHPGELKALLDTAGALGYKRVICAFQPHTYSRTKALFDEFAQVLSQPDVTYLAEIYAARETNDIGITSQDLADVILGAKAAPSLEVLTRWLAEEARPGDLILTVGAGNIYTVGESLAKQGENQ